MKNLIEQMNKADIVKEAFWYVSNTNKGNNNNYHNLKHLLFVADTSMVIAGTENISTRQSINVCLASLFHDYNHSGNGKVPDYVNIENAILGFDTFLSQSTHRMGNGNRNEVIDLIASTEFPREHSPRHVMDMIIMDADMLQCYDNDWFVYSVAGLAKERGESLSEAIEMQKKFLSTVSFYTRHGKKIHEENNSKFLGYLSLIA